MHKVVTGAMGVPAAAAEAFRRATEDTVIALTRVAADKAWVTAWMGVVASTVAGAFCFRQMRIFPQLVVVCHRRTATTTRRP